MCQLGRQMDLLLNYLRKERVHIPLKAVLTPVNQEWDSVRLYHEIKSEHEQMTGQPLKNREDQSGCYCKEVKETYDFKVFFTIFIDFEQDNESDTCIGAETSNDRSKRQCSTKV